MPQFFVETGDIVSDRVSLKGDNFHHLSKVRRVKKGDLLVLRSHGGVTLEAKVESVESDSIECVIIETYRSDESVFSLTLYLAILKGSSFDTALQKAVEVGVTSIVPVVTERTIPDIKGKIESKLKRWEKIVLEASKQCMRSFIPEVSEPVTFKDLLSIEIDSEYKILAQPDSEMSFRKLASENKNFSSVSVLIGPEGGFSDKELDSAAEKGWLELNFGKTHMRAETAAVVIPSIIIYQWS